MITFPFELALWSWLLMIPVMIGLWLVQRILHNAVVADIGFCLGLAVTAIVYGFVTLGVPMRRMLVSFMAVIYGLRLAAHLFINRVYEKDEDPRYRKLRQSWGNSAQRNFFFYFQGQALAIAVFSLPLLVVMMNPAPLFSGWDLIGLAVWTVSVIGEAVADRQLERFRANPGNRGTTCRSGLWRYSRHPNYFFESLHWWAYVVMSIGAPYWWITLIGPVLMTWALLKVSGIPFAEAQALASRGEDYRDYQRRTSAFFPWFPKQTEKAHGGSHSSKPHP